MTGEVDDDNKVSRLQMDCPECGGPTFAIDEKVEVEIEYKGIEPSWHIEQSDKDAPVTQTPAYKCDECGHKGPL